MGLSTVKNSIYLNLPSLHKNILPLCLCISQINKSFPGLIICSGVKMKVAQSCPTLCNLMDYTLHGLLQPRILECIAVPFSRGSSQPRDQTQVSCTAGWLFPSWATREGQVVDSQGQLLPQITDHLYCNYWWVISSARLQAFFTHDVCTHLRQGVYKHLSLAVYPVLYSVQYDSMRHDFLRAQLVEPGCQDSNPSSSLTSCAAFIGASISSL